MRRLAAANKRESRKREGKPSHSKKTPSPLVEEESLDEGILMRRIGDDQEVIPLFFCEKASFQALALAVSIARLNMNIDTGIGKFHFDMCR